MTTLKKKIKVKVERTIPGPLVEVFDAWLNPKFRGNPWNAGDKVILDPRVDGLFYSAIMGMPHYGRFTKVKRPAQIQHTWVSPNTLGHESLVTVTFQKEGKDTRMSLVHVGLPDTPKGRSHNDGWNYFLDILSGQFNGAAGKGK